MDPVFRIPASGTPLFPVSPERSNRQALPHSPSLPSDVHDPFKSVRSQENSDANSKVAQFNSLSKEATQRRKDNEAAMRRAVLGREEAESEAKQARDESRTLRKELEEGKAREIKLAERLKSVTEELHRNRETQAHAEGLYEKEVRRARKEAFKSSSALVKLQEELKMTRHRATLMREEMEAQRLNMESKGQETFAAQYQLIGLQEHLESARQKIKITEEERDALKASLEQEDVVRLAAEARTALPQSQEAGELVLPKYKIGKSLKESEDFEASEVESPSDMETLRQEMRWEKELRTHAESLIDFMKMECQFRCCSCRLAEAEGTEYINDGSFFGPATKKESSSIGAKYSGAASPTFNRRSEPSRLESPSPRGAASPLGETTEMLINFSPGADTCFKGPTPVKRDLPDLPSLPLRSSGPNTTANEQFDQYPFPTVPPHKFSKSVQPPEQHIHFDLPRWIPRALPDVPSLIQQVPLQTTEPSIRSVTQPTLRSTNFPESTTTTKTVPLAPLPVNPDKTMSRDKALEQIRQRRGRARSAVGNGTPRKPTIGPGAQRRDLSAPAN